jgi:integrase/recombinase XerC
VPEPALSPWVRKFLTHLRGARSFSAHTLRAYEGDLNAFMAGDPAATPETLDRARVREFIAALQADGALARATVLRKVSALRSFVRWLREQGALKGDPFANVPTPKRDKKLPKFLTESEMGDLLSQQPEGPFRERDRALLELLYSCGLRRSELSGLNVGDVDFVSGFARVFGKGSKERLVPVGNRALGALREYLRRRQSRDGGEPLFTGPKGARLSPDGVAFVLRRWIKRSGYLKSVTPHVFRHSFATHLLDQGCDLRSVQEMLGHKNLATTQVYTHVSLERLRKVYSSAHPKGEPSLGHPKAA